MHVSGGMITVLVVLAQITCAAKMSVSCSLTPMDQPIATHKSQCRSHLRRALSWLRHALKELPYVVLSSLQKRPREVCRLFRFVNFARSLAPDHLALVQSAISAHQMLEGYDVECLIEPCGGCVVANLAAELANAGDLASDVH